MTPSSRPVRPLAAAAFVLALALPAAAQDSLSLDTPTEGTVPAAGSVDYSFTATEAGQYSFTTSGATDTILRVADASGATLGENDDFGGSTNSQVVVRLEAGAAVTVGVSGYQGAEGAFGIVVARVVYEAEADLDVPQGGVATQEFTPSTEGIYTIRARGTERYDSMMRVTDGSDAVVGENDDAEGVDPCVVVEVAAGAPLTISVSGYQGAAGRVHVVVERGGVLPPVRVGQPMTELPDGTTDATGAAVRIADFHGRVLLMDFWASWCGPCRAEMPNVIATYGDLHERGFDILGVSLDHTRVDMQRFLDANAGMAWRQICDEGYWQSACAVAYGVHAIPYTVLIDREGNVVATDLRGEELRAAVERLLGDEPRGR